MFQIDQIILESSILPLSLYFEPEEIAAACISISNFMFNESIPKFLANNYTENVKNINSSFLSSAKSKKGNEII